MVPPSHDVTARFRRFYAAIRDGKPVLPPEARSHPCLLVGGLLAPLYPRYMADILRRLHELGVEARRVGVEPQGRVADNADRIRDAVLDAAAARGPVVLLAHSKGGVDATAALSLYPPLRRAVRVLVAMQSPFHGAPLAADLLAKPRVRAVLRRLVLDVFGGRPEAIGDLTPEARRAFLARHPWRAWVPTLSLATSTRSPLSLLAPAAAYLRTRHRGPADGLVLARDAVIPGSWVVRLDDMDHAASVFRGVRGFSAWRPGWVAEALLAVALALPAKRLKE
jgi:hypothetical protein